MSGGLEGLGEFGLIDRWTRGLPQSGEVLLGVGDDCAVVRVGDKELLVTSDASVESVHFDRSWCSMEDAGWRAMAGAVSDIAAMGGAPLCATVSAALPPGMALAEAEALYAGLRDAAAVTGVSIVGGDTTRAAEKIFLDVTVLGTVTAGRYVARSGARPGDVLAVTGWPGRSAAALRALMKGVQPAALPAELVAAHLRPMPRLAAGQWLARQSTVHAMIDVSDGIVQDAGHLVERGGVGLRINTSKAPSDELLVQCCAAQGFDVRQCFWAGGEDYELLTAVAVDAFSEVKRSFEAELGLPLNAIGAFTEVNAPMEVLGELGSGGFDHFRA